MSCQWAAKAIPLRTSKVCASPQRVGVDCRSPAWVKKTGSGQTSSKGAAASSNDSSEGREGAEQSLLQAKPFTPLHNPALNAEGHRQRG